MAAKFQMRVLINPYVANLTARLADGTDTANATAATKAANLLTRLDNNKFVKMVGDSRYGLCAAGDPIEGQVTVADDVAPQDGYNLGSVQYTGRANVSLDGLAATPGTGTMVVGDYVLTGTVTPRGTVLPGHPKVVKAGSLAAAGAFPWRLVAIVNGTGAVGDYGVIERVV